MIFVEAPVFTRLLPRYLTDDEYRLLQRALLANPDVGAIMPGTGGFRKMRWGDSRRGKGTRGGLRVIYYHFVEDEQVWLMTLYGKDEIDDLTPVEKGILKNAIAAERRARAPRK